MVKDIFIDRKHEPDSLTIMGFTSGHQEAERSAEAFFAEGTRYFEAQSYEKAADSFTDALNRKPQEMDWRSYLLYSLYLGNPTTFREDTKQWVVSFAKMPMTLNIALLIRVWVKILLSDQAFSAFIKAADLTYGDFRAWLDALVPADNAFLSSDFLLSGLRLTTVPDVRVERLLTLCRRRLLDYALDAGEAGANGVTRPGWAAPLAKALAVFCFNNEYVLPVSPEENQKLERLTVVVRGARSLDTFGVAVLGAYGPLMNHEYIVKGLSGFLAGKLRKQLEDVFIKHISEPQQEISLQKKIAALGDVRDDVSCKVRAQYEENPYPRWINIGSVFTDEDELDFSPLKRIPSPEFLIAGCATGSYPIGVALARPAARVTGVDLSLASLGYASRMAIKHGIRNVDFMQGDILNIESIGRKFDVIETVGVLHHMKEPEKGLRALLKVLKPGGYIKIGLYSKAGRKHITACQEKLKEMGLQPSPDGIRHAREFIKVLPEGHEFRKLLSYDDFYSASMIRDMLFHVQEHVFTIAGIRTLLEGTGLRFMGFVNLPPEAIEAFAKLYPNGADRFDLTTWEKFEESCPGAFTGMYKFWCSKPVD